MSFFEYLLFCFRSGIYYIPSFSVKDGYITVLTRCLSMMKECKCRQYHDFHSFTLHTKIDPYTLQVMKAQLESAYGVRFDFKISNLPPKGSRVDITLLCFDPSLK